MRATLALLLCLLLASCGGGSYSWGWYVVLPTTEQGIGNLRFLLSGLGWTVAVSLLAMVCSVLAGLLVALPGIAEQRWLRLVNRGYVETVRSVPVLVMLLWV